ncbi:hypothetical protein C8A01DRAFT_33499 [Parachaetomium inaequale]|uniref:Uncharacterized protein n=1 Tax=Parachaetomium inaequale TaxID=2588326 RepID=A0AAN6STW7_9PEZI|nr:hypothetical protein C8A01DRAFT_33499 [Parachaetomium inaequale]
MSQMAAVDRVYYIATFTIVALSSASGLAGVSSRPLETSVESLYGSRESSFGNSTGAADEPIADEKLLRRLVFINNQHAHFRCFQEVHYEHDARTLGEPQYLRQLLSSFY